jgi:hypothetical protein
VSFSKKARPFTGGVTLMLESKEEYHSPWVASAHVFLFINNFFLLRKICFENFSISKNNIICDKCTQILWYWRCGAFNDHKESPKFDFGLIFLLII